MTIIIPGPGEDGYAVRDDESAAEALGYQSVPRERRDLDDEREYLGLEAGEAAGDESPLITNEESYALYLGSRALAEIAAGLKRSGLRDLAAESARSAAALDDLQRRSTIAAAREQEAER